MKPVRVALALFVLVFSTVGCFVDLDEDNAFVDKTFTIADDPEIFLRPGTHFAMLFRVPTRAISPLLTVDFEVIEGKDTEVFLFDDLEYDAWLDGDDAEPLYFSRRVGSDRARITLRPGTYYVVVSNEFSVVTDKLVDVRAFLDYSERD